MKSSETKSKFLLVPSSLSAALRMKLNSTQGRVSAWTGCVLVVLVLALTAAPVGKASQQDQAGKAPGQQEQDKEQSRAADRDKDEPTPQVGSFLFSFLGLGPGLTVPGLATINADGTLTSVTGSDEGGPSNVFHVKNSAAHGQWVQTGRRTISARALFLNFDPASGVVVGITRVRIEATFDSSFNNITGQFFQSVFACPTPFTCPNPLTAAPTVPEPAAGLPFTAVRIR